MVLRAVAIVAAIGASDAFAIGTSPSRSAIRSSTPLCQFGTGNFDSEETTGFFLSPIPGKAKVRACWC